MLMIYSIALFRFSSLRLKLRSSNKNSMVCPQIHKLNLLLIGRQARKSMSDYLSFAPISLLDI